MIETVTGFEKLGSDTEWCHYYIQSVVVHFFFLKCETINTHLEKKASSWNLLNSKSMALCGTANSFLVHV